MNIFRHKSIASICVYAFLIFITGILLYPVIDHTASFCIKQDNLHQAYPFMNKLAVALHKGYLPVWDANTYGGKNFAGELQSGIFYPLNIIWCLLFGSIRGIQTYYIDLLVVFHYLICILGMYRLGITFKLSMAGSVVAALVFTFTSAVGARAGGQTCIFFGLTLLPWALYFLARYYLVKRHWKFFIFSGLVAGLEILAGHMEPFFHTVLIGTIVIIFYEWMDARAKNWKRQLFSTGMSIALLLGAASLIALPQLYYAAEYLSQCYRTVSHGIFIAPGQKVPLYIYAHWFMIDIAHLTNLLGQGYSPPDDDNIIYMGVLPLFLTVLYVSSYQSMKIVREHLALSRLLLIILVIGGLCALGYLTFFYLILYEIPLVNLVRQLGRYIILVSCSASLLTGLAVSYIDEMKVCLFSTRSSIKGAILVALTINVLYLVIFQSAYIPLAVSIPFLLTFLLFTGLWFVPRPVYFSLVILGVIIVDLFFNDVGFLPSATPFYPDHFYARNRLIDTLEQAYGKYRVTFDMNNYALLTRNLGDIYAIQTKSGYGATINCAYADFINFEAGSKSELDDLLNIRYVVTDKRLDSNFILKDSSQYLNLYERPNYYPRCYWKRQLGFSRKAIENENVSSIKELRYSDLEQAFSVDCLTPDTLIFSENYYPGWLCYDNGRKIAVYPAIIRNYPPLFRSIILGQGHHDIVFVYNKVFHWF